MTVLFWTTQSSSKGWLGCNAPKSQTLCLRSFLYAIVRAGPAERFMPSSSTTSMPLTVLMVTRRAVRERGTRRWCVRRYQSGYPLLQSVASGRVFLIFTRHRRRWIWGVLEYKALQAGIDKDTCPLHAYAVDPTWQAPWARWPQCHMPSIVRKHSDDLPPLQKTASQVAVSCSNRPTRAQRKLWLRRWRSASGWIGIGPPARPLILVKKIKYFEKYL